MRVSITLVSPSSNPEQSLYSEPIVVSESLFRLVQAMGFETSRNKAAYARLLDKVREGEASYPHQVRLSSRLQSLVHLTHAYNSIDHVPSRCASGEVFNLVNWFRWLHGDAPLAS